jgi:chromosome segregation ATPase
MGKDMLRARTCAGLRAQVAGLRGIIASDRKEIENLGKQLLNARNQSQPNAGRIAELQKQLTEAEQKANDDMDALTDIEADIAEHCGGGGRD